MRSLTSLLISASTLLLLPSFAQTVDTVGLKNIHLTCMKINNGIIAVGTDHNGVYWHDLNSFSAYDWHKIELDSVRVTAVYPHKSGPLGWAIGIGAELTEDNSELIFCSFLGGEPRKLSSGLDTNVSRYISGIDGFPDPSICGETFAIGNRKIYRRFFNDTIWHSVGELTIEGNYSSIKAREQFGIVYAGGGEGFAGIMLKRSSDKGDTWDDLFPFCYVREIDFWDSTVYVTDGSRLMLSNNNGATWVKTYQTDSLWIQKISFSDDGRFFIAALNSIFYGLPRSYLFYTSDLGSTWEKFQLPVYDIITGMDVGPDYTVYIAALTEGVFRVSLPVSDYSEVQDVLPNEFRLNNFPNPFNSSTRVEMFVPKASQVKLRVYDALGSEVFTLANDLLEKGNYNYDLDASGLSSGIYILRIEADGIHGLSRQMILLK